MELADKVAEVIYLTRGLPRLKCLIELKEMIINVYNSFRFFSFHKKQVAAIFNCPQMQIDQQRNNNNNKANFVYFTIRLVKCYLLFVLNHFK